MEEVNYNRTDECGCGVDIAAPYNTDGKYRCGRLELIEEYTWAEFCLQTHPETIKGEEK